MTGTVDMAGYLQWLNANGYGINTDLPASSVPRGALQMTPLAID